MRSTFSSSTSEATLWPSGWSFKPRLTPSGTAETIGGNSNILGPKLPDVQSRLAGQRLRHQQQQPLSWASPQPWEYSTALPCDPASSLSLKERRSQPLSTTVAAEEKVFDNLHNDVGVNRQSSHVLGVNNSIIKTGHPTSRPELHKSTASIGVCSRLLDDNGMLAQRRKSRIQGIAALGIDNQLCGRSECCPSFHTETASSIHIQEGGIDIESMSDYAADPVLMGIGRGSLRSVDENTMNSMERRPAHSHCTSLLETAITSRSKLESSVLWMHGLGPECECPSTTITQQASSLSIHPAADQSSTNLRSSQHQPPKCMFYSGETGAVYAQSLHALAHSNDIIAELLESALGTAARTSQSGRAKSQFFWIDASGFAEKEVRGLGEVLELHPLTVQDMVQGCPSDKIDRFPNYTLVAYRFVQGEETRNKTSNHPSFWKSSGEYGFGSSSSIIDNCIDNCDNAGLATNNRAPRFTCAQLLDQTDNGSSNGINESSEGIYVVLKQNCILTFHTGKERPLAERVLQRLSALHAVALEAGEEECDSEPLLGLSAYPPYTAYAILDEATDKVSPKIVEIERRVDEIDRLVLLRSHEGHEGHEGHEQMLQQMGEQRRDILQTWQALQAKPAVIASLAEQAEAGNSECPAAVAAEVTQYFGDIHSRLVAAIEACARAEAVLARSHSNYLAKISLEMSRTAHESNATTERWALLGIIVVPINIVTSFLGINLKIPGQDRDDTLNFFVLLACMIIYTIVMLAFWRWRQLA
ncbi:CorA metal ion transporter [Coemansia sp. RSA 1200]|nr:CorA metal ion transporter [Coemansia sp. RSA 1200]